MVNTRNGSQTGPDAESGQEPAQAHSESPTEMLRLQLELEKLRAQREKASAEESEKQREHEVRMWAEKAKEHERLREFPDRTVAGSNSRAGVNEMERSNEKVQIPFIGDSADPQSILTNFERSCRAQNISEARWMGKLLPFLGSRASSACARMNEEDASDYWLVKEKILEEFRMTPERSRRLFRETTKKFGESHAQLGVRLRDSFTRWIDGIGIDKTFEELEDLILREQFQNNLSSELSIFISDREPSNFQEMLKIADRYEESRQRFKSSTTPRIKVPSKIFLPKENNGQSNNRTHGIKCFSCSETGHFSRDCPNKGKANVARPKSSYFVGMSGDEGNSPYERQMVINGKLCTGIRDTGSCITILSEKFVKGRQMTGREIEITTISGQTQTLPVAEVDVISGGKAIKMDMAVAKNVPFDFLLGNDHGEALEILVKKPESPENNEIGDPVYVSEAEPYVYGSIVNGRYARTLRDSASEVNLVKPEVVNRQQYIGEREAVRSVTGQVVLLPKAQIVLEDAAGKREILACVNQHQPFTLIMGNQDGGHLRPSNKVLMVRTRSMTGPREKRERSENPAGNPNEPALARSSDTRSKERPVTQTQLRSSNGNEGESSEESPGGSQEGDELEEGEADPFEALYAIGGKANFKKSQEEDQSLKEIFARVNKRESEVDGGRAKFELDDGILVREWKSQKSGGVWRQLVLPTKLRESVLQVGHDCRLAAHTGIKKSRDRILRNFYWPGVFSDVARFVKACPNCQITRRQSSKIKAPLQPIPHVGEAFYRVGVDLVGPLETTKDSNRYLLTVICYATKYPEAVPLPSIDTERVTEELIKIFTRVGFPREIVVDNGKQFISQIAQGLWRRTGVQQKVISVYHPQSNGQVENFHSILKHMLRTLAENYGEEWDQLVPYALFAYREVPQESTGFSPFELLFAREVRGPLDILSRSWKAEGEEKKAVTTYLQDLRVRMRRAMRIVKKNVLEAQTKQKCWYDKKARKIKFQVGQKVLVLRPCKSNTLDIAWDGPFIVANKISDLNYEVDFGEGAKQTYHVNMLKPWLERFVAYVHQEQEGKTSEEESLDDRELGINFGIPGNEPIIDETLTAEQAADVISILRKRSRVFSEKPGSTTLVQHDIVLDNYEPLKIRQYRLPWSTKQEVSTQVRQMLEWGIIEESESKFASPVILIPKSDGTARFCIDFREINKRTKFDAFPTPILEEVMTGLGHVKHLTKIDLAKGFWQINLTENAKELTAFRADERLYHFKKMPFGLKNSSATFVRLMKKVLTGTESFTRCYIDDVLIFSNSWEEHVRHIDVVMEKLEKAGLTARADKCHFGVHGVDFLGHQIRGDGISPSEAKVATIKDWPRPKTKKEVRGFLGVTGYYRKFIPAYSTVASPLTNLTKKKAKNGDWSEECEKSFNALKECLMNPPLLASPGPEDEFIVQVDASDVGLGMVLCIKEPNGEERPAAYLSRKLTGAERNYSTIEKEGLCLTWAIEKCRPLLFGKQFTVQSDHNPLVWIQQMRGKNRRILRWSLLLQEYCFKIEYKKGKNNTNADGLSRRS